MGRKRLSDWLKIASFWEFKNNQELNITQTLFIVNLIIVFTLMSQPI